MQNFSVALIFGVDSGLRTRFATVLVFLSLLSTGIAFAQVSVSSISPASGPLSGGNVIRIFGSGFNANTSVWIWANQARVAQVGSTEIDVTAPARNVAGKVDVAVFSNGGVSRLVNGYNYLVGATPTPAPPTPTPTPTPTPSGTNLSACADITKSGSYTLTQDVSSGGTCFFIDADNITLNLNGHTITYGTSGGTRPTPGVLLAADWYSGYNIARSGSTDKHGNFEIYGGSIVESTNGPAKSPAIWVGESNDISPAPKVHDLTLKTFTEDSSPIFGSATASGWRIYNNNIYYMSKQVSDRHQFFGDAIWIADAEQAAGTIPDQIYSNHIYAAPQGGIRDTHKNAGIYSNDITFNSFYTNDFCIDAPADGQDIFSNTCHPTSGRGFHTNANNVYIHHNNVVVTELSQNAEYGGCEIGGAYGVQVEYDNSVNPLPPTGIRVAYNYITANAGDCDAIGLRMTSMQLAGSVTYTGNNVTTTNAGKNGRDYSLSFSDVNEVGTNFQYSGNTFRSQYAYVTVDWDGAYVVVPAGQSWLGAPKYSIDNENGGNGGGPTFTQSITVDDSTPGTIHCGANAKGYTREGSQSVQCNNQSGNPL